MKKAISILFSALLVVATVACNKDNTSERASKGSTSTASVKTEKVSAIDNAAQPASLKEIVEEAKKDGANWSVDRWREQFRKCLIAFKPYAIAMDQMMDKIIKDNSIDPEAEAEKLEKQFPGYPEMLEEFSKAAEATKNGKIVADDADWANAVKKELGIPEL